MRSAVCCSDAGWTNAGGRWADQECSRLLLCWKSVRTLPKPVAAIVCRMLTKEKSQRPNMALIAEELRQLLSVQTGQSVLAPALLRYDREDSTTGSYRGADHYVWTVNRTEHSQSSDGKRDLCSWSESVVFGLLCGSRLGASQNAPHHGSKQSAAARSAERAADTSPTTRQAATKQRASRGPPLRRLPGRSTTSQVMLRCLMSAETPSVKTPLNLQQESPLVLPRFTSGSPGFSGSTDQLDRE